MGLALADDLAAAAGSYTPVISFCVGCGNHPRAIILGLRTFSAAGPTPQKSVAGHRRLAVMFEWRTLRWEG
jgi:hypothetical protein